MKTWLIRSTPARFGARGWTRTLQRCRAGVLALAIAAGSSRAAEPIPMRLIPGESVLAVEVDATAHSFLAEVRQFMCTAVIEPDTGLPTRGHLRFDWNDVTTGNDTRDRELREWVAYSRFPYVEVRLVSVERTSPEIVARCRVAMHGQEQDVTATMTSHRAEGGWTIEGTATLDHRRWGLPKIRRFLFLTVDPMLHVRYRLRFTPREQSESGDSR